MGSPGIAPFVDTADYNYATVQDAEAVGGEYSACAK